MNENQKTEGTGFQLDIYRGNRNRRSPGALALADWMEQGISGGYQIYYMNFMFHQLRGSPNAILDQMRHAIHKGFYTEFSGQFAHHASAAGERHRLPELYLYPDLPVHKKDKESMGEVALNGGYHYNGPMRIPPISRFKEDVVDHINGNQHRYTRMGICRIDIKVADRTFDQLADYVTKTVKRGLASIGDILILPLSGSEVRRKVVHLSPGERAIRDIQSSSNVSREIAEEIYCTVLEPRGKAA